MHSRGPGGEKESFLKAAWRTHQAFSLPRACFALSILAWFVFAIAYTTPAKPPTPMAETFPRLAGSPKNRIPEAATGSLD